MIDSDDRILS